MLTPIPTIRNAIPFIPFRLQWGETYDVYRWQQFASSVDLIGPKGSEILDDRGYDESIRLVNLQDQDIEIIPYRGSKLTRCTTLRSSILNSCLREALDLFKEQLKFIADGLSFRLQQCRLKRTRCKFDGGATNSLTPSVAFAIGSGGRIRGTDIDNDEDTDVVTGGDSGDGGGAGSTRTTPQISDCNVNWSSCVADAIKTAEKLRKDAIEEYKRKTGKNPPPPYGDGKAIPGGACSCCDAASAEFKKCMGIATEGLIDTENNEYNPISLPRGIRPPYYPVRI